MKTKTLTRATSRLPTGYGLFLRAVKERIRAAQIRATLSVNAELIQLHWDIGRTMVRRQKLERWGAAVIPRLSRDIANAMPEVKGFSERNIKLMTQFATEYPALFQIGQPVVAQIADGTVAHPIGQPVVAQLPADSKSSLLPAKLTDSVTLEIVQQARASYRKKIKSPHESGETKTNQEEMKRYHSFFPSDR